MKKLIFLLLFIFLLTSCIYEQNNDSENNNPVLEETNYYNNIEIINIDQFYNIRENNDFIIYLYDETIYNSEIIETIIRYSNIKELKTYAININTIYTNNIKNEELYDDNYYFSNNYNDGRDSISGINRYGEEAILEFIEGKIKYTYSETNIIYKMEIFENEILSTLTDIMKEELLSNTINYFNESINVGKKSILIKTLIDKYYITNELLLVYKDCYISLEKEGIYVDEDLEVLEKSSFNVKINNNDYLLTQYSSFSFLIN